MSMADIFILVVVIFVSFIVGSSLMKSAMVDKLTEQYTQGFKEGYMLAKGINFADICKIAEAAKKSATKVSEG